MRVPIGVRGMGSGSGGWLGGGFPVKNKGKGKGVGRVGGQVGTGKGTGKSMRKRLSKLPFSNLPFSFSPNFAHPSSDVRNEIPAILRKFGAQFATNLRNAPLANPPSRDF